MQKLLLFICLSLTINVFSQVPVVSIEGHRGARGWMPENTIPSFIKAIELGADTLELDVVISRDNQIVVSHDQWFSSLISLDKNGKPIPADRQTDFNIYKMDYTEVKQFDVGSLGNKDFPDQQKMKVYKPLLTELFKEINKYLKKNKLPAVRYNIEIKSSPQGDNIFHPVPSVFAKMVYDEIIKSKMEKYVIIQSFDVRPLKELKKYPVKLPISFLVSNKDGIEKNIANLGFQPEIYSPNFLLVDEQTVNYCRAKGIKIVPWTVNEIADLEKMKTFGLDGIITDYPDRAVKVFRK
ncbi:MAG: glycerophosphodiester phosphodiesterase family protein [Actinomycetota bacterium]